MKELCHLGKSMRSEFWGLFVVVVVVFSVVLGSLTQKRTNFGRGPRVLVLVSSLVWIWASHSTFVSLCLLPSRHGSSEGLPPPCVLGCCHPLGFRKWWGKGTKCWGLLSRWNRLGKLGPLERFIFIPSLVRFIFIPSLVELELDIWWHDLQEFLQEVMSFKLKTTVWSWTVTDIWQAGVYCREVIVLLLLYPLCVPLHSLCFRYQILKYQAFGSMAVLWILIGLVADLKRPSCQGQVVSVRWRNHPLL